MTRVNTDRLTDFVAARRRPEASGRATGYLSICLPVSATSIGPCLDDNAVAALLDGGMSDENRSRHGAHLASCASCRSLIGLAAADEDVGARGLVRGATLGRYVVLETVGAGAMGVVYAAYDPQLRRKVALKVLRHDRDDVSGSSGGERLLREARALAKLSHPNVITLHDVGTIAGAVFLTMEFVEGGTLAHWMSSERRGLRETLALLRQAGEGLAAAHEVGLVHRDLKPENVLVVDGAVAKVTDFGLVRGAGEHDVHESTPDETTAPASLTVTGALLGTPAYMAPEQLAGKVADARSDQFSYCVTLYEALYGERPFEATNLGQLAAAIAKGRVRPAPPGRDVPTWVRKLVVRGLAAAPEHRHASMRALLDALARGPLLSGRGLAAAAAAAALVMSIAGVAYTARRPEVCTGADHAWGTTWTDARRAAVAAAFAQTGRSGASGALAEATRRLDEQRSRWLTLHREACEASRVRGEESEVMLDARMRCLDERRREVGALVSLFEQADGEMVDKSVAATLALPSLDRCAGPAALVGTADAPRAEERPRFEALEQRLAEANVLEYTGRYPAGSAVAAPLVADARALASQPLLARALLVQGKLAWRARDAVAAESMLHEAAAVAQGARDDRTAADALNTLVYLIGVQLSRPAEGRTWARYAQASIERAGGDDELEAARLRALAVVVWRRQGELDEARGLLERARVLYARVQGAKHEFQLASCDEDLAGILFDRGDPAAALVLHRQNAQVRERLFGPDHPSLAASFVNQGEDLTLLGRPDEAIPLIRRAIAILEPQRDRGGGAYQHHRLAAALRARGDFAAALAEDRESLAGAARAGEIGGYWESWALVGEGLDLLALGRANEAVESLRRAVAQRQTNAPLPERSEARFALARALDATHQPGAARAAAIDARGDLERHAITYGGIFGVRLAEIDAFLVAHPAP